MNRIVVIADDISGAAELAGAALRHGLTAEVQTCFSADTDADVICVDSDTRALAPEQAAREVGAIARRVVAAGPDWIFKKCDSVLRGSVLAEARAIAGAAGKTRITVVSANPSRGRVIRDGDYFVEGRRLHETVFARDPEHPRTTSRVVDLLGGDLTGVSAPDAGSTADLDRHAATVDAATLPAGGVDFFQALLRAKTPRRPLCDGTGPAVDPAGTTLAVCGSAASWPTRKAEADAHGIAVFALPHDVTAVTQALSVSGRALIGIGDGPATHGLSPATLVATLARTVAEILRGAAVVRLLLEGGATTAAVMRAMGWTRLRAAEVSAQGVGVLRLADATGPTLFIKPGSYPWPEEIWPEAGAGSRAHPEL